jgi:D-alanyl-D-alanine dipeptidase
MAHDHAGRVGRALALAAAAGLDTLVVAPGPDLVYLAGYDAPPLERLTALVLRPPDLAVLLVPALERPRAMTAGAGDVAELAAWDDGDDPYERVRALAPGARRVAVSDRLWATHVLGLQVAIPPATFDRAGPLLSPLRAVKDDGEVDALARAGAGADAAFAAIVTERFEGRAETDVARSLGRNLVANGHESVGFTIVASGPNGASPHHEAGDRVIRAGDAVVMDFGGKVGGYGSDITRTVFVGEPSDHDARVYETVRAAQQAAFEAARAGVAGQDVDLAARRVIERAGFGPEFVHRTGHGIGLEEHEDPYLVSGNAEPLVPGNCFSIEPGIYLEGRMGVRIEDIVHLTDQGPRRLNEAPRELTVVA